MAVTSAGILLWRRTAEGGEPEVLIAHPGGPFWANKHEGTWSLPKGEFDPSVEDGLDAAKREFYEETGAQPPEGPYVSLGHTTLKSGKVIVAWAAEGDFDIDSLVSNTFQVEWPPRSGVQKSFPEIDRVLWVPPTEAKVLLNPAQAVLITRFGRENTGP